jgi:threonine aldolase
MAVLSGVIPRTVTASEGRLTEEIVRRAIVPKVYYRSEVAAIVIENTHNLAGGTVYTVDQTRAVVRAARDHGLSVHVDGARLWNAAVAQGVEPRDLAAGADTLMVTLSKGLCAPVGSLLLGGRDRMAEARRVRKQLGGGMRQVGVLAAAGLVAIERMIPRLAEDHEHARLLAAALSECPGVFVIPPSTNIVVAELETANASDVVAALEAQGVLASAMDRRTLRLVTHRDVSRPRCERAADVLRTVLG